MERLEWRCPRGSGQVQKHYFVHYFARCFGSIICEYDHQRRRAPLSVNVSGVPGIGGLPGKAGPPGGVGGPGGSGWQGKPGGNVVIRYASVASAPTASAASPTPPTASALGGPGGPGGAGGKAGGTLGVHEGKAGPDGPAGPPGQQGTVSITQVAAGDVFTGLEADWLSTWSAYRTQVGEYLFRLFDSASLVQAQAELPRPCN